MRNAVEAVVERSSPAGDGLGAWDLRRPGQLRRIGVAYLRLWKLDELAESVELLISELVTNAFRHGTGAEVTLRMIHGASKLRLEVCDGSPDQPYERAAGPEEESGRGMLIVASVAASWGVSPDGITTWCTLTIHTSTRRSR
ncbi:ATP-binding protein [Streptomyces sp. NBC_00322]|uniref:ATP-binding protein n=1 Tax=Streptomyces sp. NBC_00322 TaxID=2975712 RepID=UPI002E2E6FC5|nr:ATP-binding protein [Streptomyces sp. NBC_00322]